MVDSTINLDTSSYTSNDSKHDYYEEVKPCIHDKVDEVSEIDYSIEKYLSFDSNEMHDNLIRENSNVLIANIANDDRSSYVIISCSPLHI